MTNSTSFMQTMDAWIKHKVALPAAATFPNVSPQKIGLDFLYVAAILLIMRALGTILYIGGSWLEPSDLLATMLIGFSILGFVVRQQCGTASVLEVAAGRPPLEASMTSKMGWLSVTALLLLFNLFCFFPGDIYYTIDVVVFFFITLSCYLQGIPQQEVFDHIAETASKP